MHWIAGECVNLADYGFRVSEMWLVLDLMDKGMNLIVEDRRTGLNNDHVMIMFDPLYNGKWGHDYLFDNIVIHRALFLFN